MVENIIKAYRVGVPLVAYQSPDAEHTISRLHGELESVANPPALLSWDCVDGLRARNAAAKECIQQVGSEHYSIVDAVHAVKRVPPRVVLIMLNAHLFVREPASIQVLANVRDEFKAQLKQIVLISHAITIPAELSNDVLMIVEPLPSAGQLRLTVQEICEAAEVSTTEAHVAGVTEAVVGLTAFAAENVTSMAISKAGVDVSSAWSQKKAKINATPGLQWVDGSSFSAVGGCSQVKELARRIMCGNRSPSAIVFIDEIEKAIAGAGTDTSGVSTDQLGFLLSWMQDHSATGMIFVGPPGAAKSALAKAIGGEFHKPTIQLDLGAAKGSLVGESEARIRDAMSVIDAIAGGQQTLWIATCNSLQALPPELRRRFRLGTWFFDLPNESDRALIWQLYCTRFGLQFAEEVLRHELTGAEIESACDIADRTGVAIAEALQFLVPVAKSAADWLLALRQSADGKLLDASRPGVYTQGSREPSLTKQRQRCFE